MGAHKTRHFTVSENAVGGGGGYWKGHTRGEVLLNIEEGVGRGSQEETYYSEWMYGVRGVTLARCHYE